MSQFALYHMPSTAEYADSQTTDHSSKVAFGKGTV